MAKLILDDAVLHYVQTGAGPDIVWVPGGDMRGSDWEHQLSAFERGFRNTTYDPRGVGETEALAPPPWSIADFAADCAALIRAKCETPVFLVGLSMGSLITQQVALDYPDLVRCAIPMGTCARATGFLREWMAAEIEFRRNGGRLSGPFAIAHYSVLMFPAAVLGDDEVWSQVRSLVARDYEERDGEMLAAQWEACLAFDSLDRLRKCQVPMHVVAFSQDVQTPPARGKAVADAAPKGRFHLLEGLGHLSLAGHKPEVVNACIREIIEGYL